MTESTTVGAVDRLIDFVRNTRFEDLSPAALTALKTFTLDSLGVGISGSRVGFAASLINLAQHQWGAGAQARVLGTGERLPALSAALVNGWQIHNQEFDCVHEPAVVHPLATILSTLLAFAERQGGVAGRDFLVALSVAVDVATVLGMACGGGLRFFRPAICGALGASLALARLAGFDRRKMLDAFGLAYSQAGGTMQAHVEGSPALAMQIGFNARNVIAAIDLAAAGLSAPHDVLEGPFGFFQLFETGTRLSEALAQLGRIEQITRVSHKPFPTGRAAHGGLDGLRQLRARHGFEAADIERITLRAPPLILRLVARQPYAGMAPNYARLCLGYVAASLLLDGEIDVACYGEAQLNDPKRIELAQRVRLEAQGIDPNAMTPQALSVALRDGRVFDIEMPAVLGSPERPLSLEQHLEKFRRCCRSGRQPLPESQIEALIRAVDELPGCRDVSTLVDLSIYPATQARAPQ